MARKFYGISNFDELAARLTNLNNQKGTSMGTGVITVDTIARDITGTADDKFSPKATTDFRNIARNGGYDEYFNTYGASSVGYTKARFIADIETALNADPYSNENDGLRYEYAKLTGKTWTPGVYSRDSVRDVTTPTPAPSPTASAPAPAPSTNRVINAITTLSNNSMFDTTTAANIDALEALTKSGRTGGDMGELTDLTQLSDTDLRSIGLMRTDKGGIDLGNYILNPDLTITVDPNGLLQTLPTPTPAPAPTTTKPTANQAATSIQTAWTAGDFAQTATILKDAV